MSHFQAAQTIDEVIDQLERIIQWCMQNRSRLGYFPILYQAVTKAVKAGIEQGQFEDGPRMERLDVIFANRYLEAWHQFQNNEEPTRVWRCAFRAASKSHIPALKHLLLGINAHINLDLGIAVAETIGGPDIEPIKSDFDEINRLLFEMVDGVQDKLGAVYSFIRWSDHFLKKWDEKIAQFSLKKARDNAWRVATIYAQLPNEQRPGFLTMEDMNMADFAALLRGIGIRAFILDKVLQLLNKAQDPLVIMQELKAESEIRFAKFYHQ